MKKILILGGGGFIGINLAKHLYSVEGIHVTIADNVISRDIESYLSLYDRNSFEIVLDDFSSLDAYQKLGIDYDQVYVLAAIVGVNPTLESPEKVIEINTKIILNCLEWLKRCKKIKVVFTSTSEVYAGAIDSFKYPVPTDELVPVCISNIGDKRFTYAVTKIMGESAFLSYARKYQFNIVVVRYHNVFGSDMGFKHVIPHLVERFLKGESPFLIYGHDQTRAFSYVDDAVKGTILAMNKEGISGEIFHIGSEEEISIERLTKTVGKMMGYTGGYEYAPSYPGSVARRCPDINKAKKLLGYQPITPWESGLKSTVDWYVKYFESNGFDMTHGFRGPEFFAETK